jgi:hypothetical protein
MYLDVKRPSAIQDMNGVTLAHISAIKKVNLAVPLRLLIGTTRLNRVDYTRV